MRSFSLSITNVTTLVFTAVNELTVQEQRSYRTNNGRIGRNGYARRSDNTGGICRARFNILHTVRHIQEDTRSRSTVAKESPSDTPRAHRAIHRSWWNNELPKSQPNPLARPFFAREQLMGGDTLMLDRLSIDRFEPCNLSPVIKVTIERNNSDESRNFPLTHSLPPQSTLLNGSSVTRNLRFWTQYNIIDRQRNNCELRAVHKRRFVLVLEHK